MSAAYGGEVTLLELIDISAAFDMVDHNNIRAGSMTVCGQGLVLEPKGPDSSPESSDFCF